MRLLAAATEVSEDIDEDWSSWVAPMERFISLSSPEQLAAICSHPGIAEEVFVHLPAVRRTMCEQYAGRLPSSALVVASHFTDTLPHIRAALVRGDLSPDNTLVPAVEAAMELQEPDTAELAKFVEFFFGCATATDRAAELLDTFPLHSARQWSLTS